MRLAEEERKHKNEILNGYGIFLALTVFRNTVAKKYTGKITVVQPFSLSKSKVLASLKFDVILDVDITIPPNKEASLKIRKGDSVK